MPSGFGWPAGLVNVIPLRDGFEQTSPNNVIRQDMDVGPAKIRARSTAGYRQQKNMIVVTAAELAIFITFYETTLKYGALDFLWDDPITGSEFIYRFVEPPNWQTFGLRFKVNMSLEYLAV